MSPCSKCKRTTDPYCGGPLPEDGKILCGYCADERIGQLESLAVRLGRFARRVISKLSIGSNRWPCPSCGRGENEPLRLVGYAVTSDGSRPTKVTHWTGCFVCNEHDPLVSEAKELIGAP